MALDFATQTFTFKIDLAFNFEMKGEVQIDARENGKSWKRLAQHLVKWPKSTQNMKVIDRFIDLLTRLSWAAQNGNRSFRTQVISYPSHLVPFWSFRTHFYFQFGHFVPSLVISYLLLLFSKKNFGHFVPIFYCFVPKSFRTQVISYPF